MSTLLQGDRDPFDLTIPACGVELGIEDLLVNVPQFAAQDRFQFAYRAFEHSDPVVKPLEDVGLDRARDVHVVDKDLFVSLAEPIETADPLRTSHRVPRQVVVDKDVAELEAQPPRTNF